MDRQQELFHDDFSRVLKNKHQAVSQSGYKLEARGSKQIQTQSSNKFSVSSRFHVSIY